MRADLTAAVAELRREGRIITAPPEPSVPQLKPDQVETLQLYCAGVKGNELAAQLGVTLGCAQQRLKRIAAHLGVAKVRDLPAWAAQNELDKAA